MDRRAMPWDKRSQELFIALRNINYILKNVRDKTKCLELIENITRNAIHRQEGN